MFMCIGKSNKDIGILALMTLAVVPGAYAQTTTTKSPAALNDNAYVTLSGTVGEITDADEFMLKYKGYRIQVDTNDYWPNLFGKDAIQVLKPGDKVTVTGKVDDNWFTKKEIDATSISTGGKNYSRVYWRGSNNMSNYGSWPYYGWNDEMYEERVGLSGTVSKVTGDNTFEMKYGTGTVKVDTSGLDIIKANMLNRGDRVTVYGNMDDNWFGKRELNADYLIRTNVYHARG